MRSASPSKWSLSGSSGCRAIQLSPRQAGLVVSMSSGASSAAAELAASASPDGDEAMEFAVAYILAGIERVESL